MGLKGGHQQKKERPHPFNQPSFPPPTQNNGLLPKNCRLRTALCWPWGCSPSTVEPMTLVGVTCSQEPLEQLSIQQELAKGNVWGRNPSPCTWALPGSGVSLNSFLPSNAWAGKEENSGSCWSSAFPGEPKSQPCCSRRNQKPISSQQRRCSQHQPAPLGTNQTTSYSISWLLQPPRSHRVALEGTDAESLEASPKH